MSKVRVTGQVAARQRWVDNQASDLMAPSAAEAARKAAAALRALERFSQLEAESVRIGRAGGVSWDRLGVWLHTPGETLRRRYGGDGG